MYVEFMMRGNMCLADDFSTWFAGYRQTCKVNAAHKASITSKTEADTISSDATSSERLNALGLVEKQSKLESAKESLEFESPIPGRSINFSIVLSATKKPLTPPPSPDNASKATSQPASIASRRPTVAQLQFFKTKYFEIRKSNKGGLGAFAITNIPEGTVILSEKALFRATFADLFYEYENLSKEQLAQYHSLFGWTGVDPYPVIAIYKTNRFATTNNLGGIFVKSSRFNHQCHPHASCTYRFDDEQNRLITKTLRDIKEGEEITISYGGSAKYLHEEYGFWCDCPKCSTPYAAQRDISYNNAI